MNSGLSLMMVLLLVGTNPTMPQTTLTAQLHHSEKVEADRLFNQGLQQYQENQYESAIASWQSALKLYRKIRDRPGEAQTLLHQGKVSLALARYGEALQLVC